MNKFSYFSIWAGLFVLCAVLGFIPAPAGFLRLLMILLSMGFFVPPALILFQSSQDGDRQSLSLIRNLSAASLGLTLLLLVGNFLCLMAPEALGNVLYAVLVIVSAPMICGQYWILGLFGWACLLVGSFSCLRKKK